MLVAHRMSHFDVHAMCHGEYALVHTGGRNEQADLKRITAALRQLTPDQRKHVAVELTAPDAQPALTVLMRRLHMCRDVPVLSVYARDQERPRQRIVTLSLSGVLQDV